MLTSLDFLKAGEQWPPRSEKYRLDRYQDNRALAEVYKEQFKRIERVIGNFSQVVSYAVLFNYQKLISLKIADLVFGEPPKITVADEKIQKVVDEILVEQEVLNAAYEAAIDALNGFDNLDDCMIYIAEHYAWNPNSDGAVLLMELLERKYL